MKFCAELVKLFLVLFSVACSAASCNLLKMLDRHQRNNFERKDLKAYTFRSDKGIHFTHYIHSGKPKLMLLHGYGASGVGQYYRTALALSKEYDLIVPDLLYCGRSIGDSSDFSIDAQVEHVKLLLDSLQMDTSVTVVGNSYGGVVASYFAEKYPEYVNKLVVYDAPINCYSRAYADSLAHTLGVPDVTHLLSPVNVYENKISLDLVFHKQPYIPRFIRRQMVKYGSLPVRDVQIKLLHHLTDNEKKLNDHYFRWHCPVFLAWGEFDLLIPTSTRDCIANRYDIPDEQSHTFANAAHAANVEFADEFISYIRKVMEEK